MAKNGRGVLIKVLFFLLILTINSFIVLYYIYSYCEFYFFKSKQGAKLELKNKERRRGY